jgi:misacylated tRNA(Ala) deacylase
MELLFRDDAYLKSCSAEVTSADDEGIRLDRTVFYPEGGGQQGDTGWLDLEGGESIEIVDTRKSGSGDGVIHIPAEGTVPPSAGTKVTARIDWERRHRLMRMHTCLHLLCAVVEGDVTSGQIGDGKGRLDFNLPDGSPDKQALAQALNNLIEEDHPAVPRWIEEAELAAQPELVRTLSVKPPSGSGRVRLLEIKGVDLQPCGGTHVKSTGEIGPIEVGKIENKGKQNRRINLRFAG